MNKRFITQLEVDVSKPDVPVTKVKELLSREKIFDKGQMMKLIATAQVLFEREANVLELSDPIKIIGDLHGQFFDFLKILSICGEESSNKLLLLGDYVDRGGFSVELLTLLLYLKVRYPNQIFMLRGNHESRNLTNTYGFRTECIYKYDLEVYESLLELFDCLPFAAVINGIILAAHAGISDKITEISELSKLDRFAEPPLEGPICDILWSDVNYDEEETEIIYNSKRGCSIFYTKDLLLKLFEKNNIICLIRAHETCENGFKMQYWADSCFPSILTIFSAPNYCDTYGNKAAIAVLDNCQLNIKQFHMSEHPFILKNHEDIIHWSAPLIVSKILSFFSVILKSDKKRLKVDEYLMQRAQEIDQTFSLTLEEVEKSLGKKVRPCKDIEVPQDEAVLHIPKIMKCKPELMLLRHDGVQMQVKSGSTVINSQHS